MEAFTMSFTGIGAQITTAITALAPIALFTAALILAMSVLSWFVSMVGRARAGGKAK